MLFKKVYILPLLILFTGFVRAQDNLYDLVKLPISTNRYDEFAPVKYEDGMVYTSDMKRDVLLTYRTSDNSLPLNIYYTVCSDSAVTKKARLFNRNFASLVNDGPISFSGDFTRLVYSRNLEAGLKLRDVKNEKNTLGLFVADRVNGEWLEAVPFPFNSDLYSLTTPALDNTGTVLLFSSDMPDGQGKADLYVSRYVDGNWQEPKNLGPEVNSTGNDCSPFISATGDLYFSSDGHEGYGGKDLLVSKRDGNSWGTPILLKAPLNSAFDDISIWTDAWMEEGYIASNRENSDDIYAFKGRFYPFADCRKQRENQYCYRFFDENVAELSTPYTKYEWVFSDGTRMEGLEVEHCFPGSGHYEVKLNMIDEITGNVFFTQSAFDFEIETHKQPYIVSPGFAIKGEPVCMNALLDALPAFEVQRYYWDMNDGNFEITPRLCHTYTDTGHYNIQLGVIGIGIDQQRQEHCVTKSLAVYDDVQEMVMATGYGQFADPKRVRHEIDSVNRGVAFNTYSDLLAYGYAFLNLDPSKRLLFSKRLKHINYRLVSFSSEALIPTSYAIVDTIQHLLVDFPSVSLDVIVHLDSISHINPKKESLQRAQRVVTELVKGGIDPKRINYLGLGAQRPVEAFKLLELEKFNNRIEFVFRRGTPGKP